MSVFGDILHLVPQEEPVVQGGQGLFLREFRGGAHQRLEGALEHLAVVVEEPLVDQGEEAVQDRAVRLPDLVEEREVRLRQVAAGEPREPVLLQGRDGHGAEQFVGQGEAGQEPLEIFRALDGAREEADHQAFRGALRSDQEQVLPRQEGEQESFELLAAFEEVPFHLLLEGLELGGLDHTKVR